VKKTPITDYKRKIGHPYTYAEFTKCPPNPTGHAY
jgi:hypothetical protein